MVNRALTLGGRICLAAFPLEPALVDVAKKIVRNNLFVCSIRARAEAQPIAPLMRQKRFNAKLLHTHTFPMSELPTALRYARDRIDNAVKVVVKIRES